MYSSDFSGTGDFHDQEDPDLQARGKEGREEEIKEFGWIAKKKRGLGNLRVTACRVTTVKLSVWIFARLQKNDHDFWQSRLKSAFTLTK